MSEPLTPEEFDNLRGEDFALWQREHLVTLMDRMVATLDAARAEHSVTIAAWQEAEARYIAARAETPAAPEEAFRTIETFIIRSGDPDMGTPTWQHAMDALDVLRAARAVTPAAPGHAFANIDPEALCPTCGFPAWTHDPATAFLYTRTVRGAATPAAPEALREAAVALWNAEWRNEEEFVAAYCAALGVAPDPVEPRT